MPQFGEENIINEYFPKSYEGFYVDIGAGGRWSNVEFLEGWKGISLDKETGTFITKENVNEVLDNLKAPKEIDILTIDIDGNDYYIWETIALTSRMVIIEFNRFLAPEVIYPYVPDFVWDGSNNYGCSKEALIKLGEKKNMVVLAEIGDNLIFISKKYMKKPVDTEEYWSDRLVEFKDNLRLSILCAPQGKFEELLQEHIKALEPYKYLKVLDAGCAYGRMSEYFEDYLGVDFVHAFIDKAKELYPEKRFEVQNLKDLPYDNKAFDLAFCIMVKQNVTRNLGEVEWLKMEKELHRVAEEVIILET